MKKGKLKVAHKVYTMEYLIQNPPANAKGLKVVWAAAVTSYFAKEGIDLTDVRNYKKPVEGIDFSELVKTFQKLAGAPKAKKAAPSKKTA